MAFDVRINLLLILCVLQHRQQNEARMWRTKKIGLSILTNCPLIRLNSMNEMEKWNNEFAEKCADESIAFRVDAISLRKNWRKKTSIQRKAIDFRSKWDCCFPYLRIVGKKRKKNHMNDRFLFIFFSLTYNQMIKFKNNIVTFWFVWMHQMVEEYAINEDIFFSSAKTGSK